MNIFTNIAMFGWIPVVLLLFANMNPRRAITVAFVLAWLFLPIASFKLAEGIPLFTKVTATCIAVLLGAMLFDHHRLLTFRLRWFDLPMAIWCICPFFSSITNDLGFYDGFSAALYQTIDWGVPYLIGRVYYSDREGVRELAIAIMLGGLIYMPFCLYEIRMSPQLHSMVYGTYQHDFSQTIRFGGWRPTVFMEHGLAVGLWMAMASLVAVWLWMSGTIRLLLWIPMMWWALVLTLVTVACKSTGALILLAAGIVAIVCARYMRTWLVLAALLAIAPTYMALRSVLQWDGRSLVTVAESWVGQDRADSLEFRINNEDMLTRKALQRPAFGWGRWGRARVYDDSGRDISVTDGLWIIALGNMGLIGLAGITGVLILPGILLICKLPTKSWATPQNASIVALVTLLGLYMVDNLSNAMINPVFILAAGGVTGCLGLLKQQSAPVGTPMRDEKSIIYKQTERRKRRGLARVGRRLGTV